MRWAIDRQRQPIISVTPLRHHGGMDVAGVVERVRVIAAVRADAAAGRCDREAALTEVRRLRAWVDASEADLAAGLAAEVSFPEDTIATTSKGSIGAAAKTLERSDTLGSIPSFAAALDDGAITSGHVDAVTRAAKGLEPDQRAALLERVGGLVNMAAHATQAEFGRRVRDEARRLQQSDGMDRLERQRRATSLRTWVDDDGMWNLRGRFDLLTGVRVSARLDATVETLFAEATPSTSPSDPRRATAPPAGACAGADRFAGAVRRRRHPGNGGQRAIGQGGLRRGDRRRSARWRRRGVCRVVDSGRGAVAGARRPGGHRRRPRRGRAQRCGDPCSWRAGPGANHTTRKSSTTTCAPRPELDHADLVASRWPPIATTGALRRTSPDGTVRSTGPPGRRAA